MLPESIYVSKLFFVHWKTIYLLNAFILHQLFTLSTVCTPQSFSCTSNFHNTTPAIFTPAHQLVSHQLFNFKWITDLFMESHCRSIICGVNIYSKCFRQGSEYSPMYRATILSLFLRFVLVLQYYVLENITVLISKKCPHLWLASLFFLIFCSVTFLNRQYLMDMHAISI